MLAPKPRDLLVYLAREADLWHDPDKEAFATNQVGGHFENHRIRSKGFKRWLTGRYYVEIGGAAPRQAFDDALGALEANAVHDGPQHEVALRIAEHHDAIYLDLADQEWRAVEITAKGWQVMDKPPVRFIRTLGMRALPIPERGGSVNDLEPFLNIATEGDFRLLVGSLLAALRPGKSFPIVVLNGEQGSAKSTTSRVLRSLVDPSAVSIRGGPREERDLVATARNSWMIVYDNLSRVPAWLSDALCRLSTGGGLGGRQLYTDYDEAVFDALRPCVINGIPDLATRPDLTDRAVVLKLSPIPDEKRMSEVEFWSAFETLQPRILGALLNAVSCALRRISAVKLDCKPRMVDFALWVTAAEEALGWPDGAFMEAYAENRAIAVETSIESDPVAVAVKELAHANADWDGTPTQLLDALTSYAPDAGVNSRIWPQAPNALTNRLRRVAPGLRQLGIEIEDYRKGKDRTRMILIRKVREKTVRTVRRAADSSEIKDFPADDGGRSADDQYEPTVRAKPLNSMGADDADGADDDLMNPNTWETNT